MPAQEKEKTEGVSTLNQSQADNEPEKDLFTWKAPARPFKRRNREFYITLFAIVGIVSLILFLAEGFMPVLLIVALVFLFYILNTVEPETIEYKITNKGVKVADRRTNWGIITRFWFSKRFESDLLIFETQVLPGRLELMINKGDRNKLRKEISEFVKEEEAPPTYLDRSASWMSRKLPGNN